MLRRAPPAAPDRQHRLQPELDRSPDNPGKFSVTSCVAFVTFVFALGFYVRKPTTPIIRPV
jgi:hypothetical protein